MVAKSRGPGPPQCGHRSASWMIRVFAILGIVAAFASSETNKRYDMQTLCEDRFRQQLYRKIEGAFLKSQNERNLDCIVTFQTHSILQRFMLRFDQLQLDCNDHLFIYDGAHIVDSYKVTSADEEMSAKGPKLTREIKGLLRTDVDERTAEDKSRLFRIIGHLSCFQRYPEKVRQGLTASAVFSYFGPGRVLVTEGHPSVAMYFIISGRASVTKMLYDPGEDKIKPKELATMSDGDSFGEINILYNEPWPTTVTTLTHIELLRVMKKDLQSILEEFLGEQKDEIMRYLSCFTFFKDWTHRMVVECCILSRVRNFSKDDLILGDKVGNHANAYFIVSGECIVMHHLVAQVNGSRTFGKVKIFRSAETDSDDAFPLSKILKGEERPRLRKIGEPHIVHLIVGRTLDQMMAELPLGDSKSSKDQSYKEITVESHFFKIALLMPGQCFGIGESLDNKFILGNSYPVVILEIPRYFLNRNNRGNIWGRVREFFNLTYPSPEVIFKKFIMERKWQLCRREYLKSVLRINRPFTGLTAAEQPYYYRLLQDIMNPSFKIVRKTLVKEKSD